MGEFLRKLNLEEDYLKMHKLKPEIHRQIINNDRYNVKLKLHNKEVTLTEQLRDGLTEYVTIAHNGITENTKSMYEAELKANEILKRDKLTDY